LHRCPKVLSVLFLQKPQKTLVCSPVPGLSIAVFETVPESRTKEIGKAPRFPAAGGGQSWLVG